MKEETTILGVIWDWISAIFGFIYDWLSIIPFTTTPWLNFVISIPVILIILGIIGTIFEKREEKAKEARAEAERLAEEAREEAERLAEEERKEAERLAEEARWNALTKEEQEAELAQKAAKRLKNNTEKAIGNIRRYGGRNWCPAADCDSGDTFGVTNRKRIDRYDTTKEVWETAASGERKSRQVKCTKVIEDVTYCCDVCGYSVTQEETRELK